MAAHGSGETAAWWTRLARRSPIPLLVLPKRRTTERDESAPRRILTPVDFSIASAVALRTAVELARRHGARLTLLHSLNDVPRHMTFSGGGAWEVVRRLPARKEAAAERLRRKAAFFGADDVDTEVATGLADGAILEIARRSDPDLIVMGSAHRSWLDRVLFGSTLRRVLRRATVPVLVVPVVAGAHTWPNEHLVDQLGSRVVDRFRRRACRRVTGATMKFSSHGGHALHPPADVGTTPGTARSFAQGGLHGLDSAVGRGSA